MEERSAGPRVRHEARCESQERPGEPSLPIPDPTPPIDWEEAARLYSEEGLSYAEVARRLGRNGPWIRRGLVARRVPRRQHSRARRGRWGKNLESVWSRMRQRCHNPRDPSYRHYGAKGIEVCPEWKDFDAFYAWAMASGYKPRRVLALKEKARTFSPSTCRWVSWAEWTKLRLQFAWPRARRRRRTRRGIPWDEAVRLHTEEGLSSSEVARALKVRLTTIWMGLKRLGVYRKKERKLGGDTRIRKRLQDIWYTMHRRCRDPKDGAFRFYGARGARVSDEWHGFEPFYSWAVPTYRPGLCLSRLDHEGPYSPANCTWTTRSRAGWRAKHPPRKAKPRWTIRAFGEVKGPTAWSTDSRCSVTLTTLIARLRGGMEPAKAIAMLPKGGVGPTTRFVSAFGETKGITAWSRDRRCRVTLTTLCRRLQCGLDPEAAIATPPFKLPFKRRMAGADAGSAP